MIVCMIALVVVDRGSFRFFRCPDLLSANSMCCTSAKNLLRLILLGGLVLVGGSCHCWLKKPARLQRLPLLLPLPTVATTQGMTQGFR